jgi:hypothetical protein
MILFCHFIESFFEVQIPFQTFFFEISQFKFKIFGGFKKQTISFFPNIFFKNMTNIKYLVTERGYKKTMGSSYCLL